MEDGAVTVTARGLLLTVLGEFVLPAGAAAPTSAFIDLLGRLAVEEKAARQALARSGTPRRRPAGVHWSTSDRVRYTSVTNVPNSRSGSSSVTATVRGPVRSTPRSQVACSAMSGLARSTSSVAGSGIAGGPSPSNVDSALWTPVRIRSRASSGCRLRAAYRLIDSLTATCRTP